PTSMSRAPLPSASQSSAANRGTVRFDMPALMKNEGAFCVPGHELRGLNGFHQRVSVRRRTVQVSDRSFDGQREHTRGQDEYTLRSNLDGAKAKCERLRSSGSGMSAPTVAGTSRSERTEGPPPR